MSLIDNIDDVAFTSSLDNDKILESYSGSFAIGAGATETEIVPHAHGASVFPVARVSLDNATFIDAPADFYTSGTQTIILTVLCSSDASDIRIVATNPSGTTKTCYYKVVLLAED